MAVVSTASAYQCPGEQAINVACNAINVHPLVCNYLNANVEKCNEKQCSQAYIDNYAACHCRSSSSDFYTRSASVQSLIERCGLASLTNPYGSPDQYRAEQTFSIQGGSLISAAYPSPSPEVTPSHHMSGGAIAGLVIGLVCAALLAGAMAVWWRSVRDDYAPPYDDYEHKQAGGATGPTRTVVTEKVEPVVVRATGPDHIVPIQNDYQTVPVHPGNQVGATVASTTIHPIQNHSTVAVSDEDLPHAAGVQFNAVPQNNVSQSSLPQNAVPQNAVPQNSAPRGNVPLNAAPRSSGASNAVPPPPPIKNNSVSH
ncbi:hypothetical protein BGZ49_004402 [Haplosporangium sp. Z 27]|nr:hypothetical protein BGZ49_004402 [Haplosporangium sp. Z 27]